MRAPTKTQAATAIETSTKTLLRTPDILSPEQARRAKSEREEEHAERHRGSPGRPVERGGEALEDAQQHGADHRAGEAAQAAEHADRENATDIFASDRRLDRLDDDEERAGDRRGGDGDAERDALDAGGGGGH